VRNKKKARISAAPAAMIQNVMSPPYQLRHM
jgi:hypothetical protein